LKFLKVNIFTKPQGIDSLCAMLCELGVEGFDIHDSSLFDDFVKGNIGIDYDYIDESLESLKTTPTHITFYLEKNHQGEGLLLEIRQLLKCVSARDAEIYGDLNIEVSLVDEQDWENNWKEYYKPFCIGDKFLIKPTWERIDIPQNKLVLELDPASAFGTGQHATTKLCIEALEKIPTKDFKLLDIGTGSGILSIAGLLLGVKQVSIVDISENALKIASENIALNGGGDFTAFWGDVCYNESLVAQIGGGYDIVIANIVSDIIIDMAQLGLFNKFLSQNGNLLVSGIIDQRLKEVEQALENANFEPICINKQEGWNLIVSKIIK